MLRRILGMLRMHLARRVDYEALKADNERLRASNRELRSALTHRVDEGRVPYADDSPPWYIAKGQDLAPVPAIIQGGVLSVECPYCGAPPFMPCLAESMHLGAPVLADAPHDMRVRAHERGAS